MVSDALPPESKKRRHASKFKPAEVFPSSASDMPASSFTSLATDVAPTELNATIESIEYDYSAPGTTDVTPFDSTIAVGKSPTSSMRQKITTTFKSVEYESFVPCPSTERPEIISRTLSKSPTGSIVKRFNTTIKSVEYESYVQNPSPEKPSYNPKGKPKYEAIESCSSAERNYYDSEVLDDVPTDTGDAMNLKQRHTAKFKNKNKYKSYDSRLSCPKSKDNERLAIEKKKIDSKSKSGKYKPHGSSGSRPVISIITSGKSTEDKINSIKFKSSVTVLPSVVTTDASFSEVDYVVNYGSKSDMEDKPPYIAASKGNLNVAHFVGQMAAIDSGKLKLTFF